METSEVARPTETRPIIRANGSFIFPPIWIGPEPKPTFREEPSAFGTRPQKYSRELTKGDLSLQTIMDSSPFAEEDRAKATNYLNEIMSLRLLDGKPVFSFREQEVEEATIDPETKTIGSYGVPSLSLRASLMEEQWNTQLIPVYGKRDVVTVDEFRDWISRADNIALDAESADYLRLLLEAYTHLQDFRYFESFVLSWVVIEKNLYTTWKRYLKEDTHALRARRDKLTNPIVWSADYVIEGLALTSQISPEQYSEFMAVKSVRNDIVHEGERVSKEMSQRSFELALRIVR